MKIFLIIFISIFFSFFANGQKNNLQSKRIVEEYSWRTATNQQIDSFYFGLMPLQQIDYPFYVRISLLGQIIDCILLII